MKRTMKKNHRNRGNGFSLLEELGAETVALAFFDPQYRGVLDELDYGNEGRRQKQRFTLTPMGDTAIIRMLGELGRVLKPSGYLMLWTDKFTVASGRHTFWLHNLSRQPAPVTTVDMLTWDTRKWGMGSRLRSTTQFLLILQKRPHSASRTWRDRSILDLWPETKPTSNHPHAKPLHLQIRLIQATTRPGDLVVDPCAGSFSVFDACRFVGRDFLGTDLRRAG